ncbi:MAG: hypothetical protein ACOY0T_15545 [Myxococcota bacterium]
MLRSKPFGFTSPGSRQLGRATLVTLVLHVVACRENSTTASTTPAPKTVIPSAANSANVAAAGANSAVVAAPTPTPAPTRTAPLSAPPTDAQRAPPLEPGKGPFIVDEPADVGPAGPASAHDNGIVLVDKTAKVALAKRGTLPSGTNPGTPTFTAIDRPREDFLSFGRGPALVGGFAYFINQENLVRVRVGSNTEPEVLVKEARKGARVVGVEGPDGAPLIGFITRPDASGAPHAKLWSNGKMHDLTPEGAGASSIALVTLPGSWLAITLDGRSGMTPLHVRKLTRDKPASVALGPDVVAWVGASAQATTEVFAIANDSDAWAFVPIEQDVTHFGLAQIHIGNEPRLDAPAHFLTYENGTNSAPVATGKLCGRAVVAFAEPDSAAPKAPQRLMLAAVGANGLETGEVIARGRAFANVSLAPSASGALLSYTADHRTWARSLRCRA